MADRYAKFRVAAIQAAPVFLDREKTTEKASIYPDLIELENVACPVLLHYGTADSLTPMSEIERIKKTLEQQQKPYELYLYEKAGHAFMNTHGGNYHQEAAEASWPRTVGFFSKTSKRIGSVNSVTAEKEMGFLRSMLLMKRTG